MVEHRTISYVTFRDDYASKDFLIGYDENDEVIMIYRENRTRVYLHIIDFPYYFCVRLTDVKNNKQLFQTLKVRKKIKSYEIEGEFVKIFCKATHHYQQASDKEEAVRLLTRSGIETFEADLNPYQRLFVDLKLKVAEQYRILYFDIETDDRGKGIEIGARRIVSIAAVDAEDNVYYWTGEDEAEILRNFFAKVVHYDLISGWNSEKFDIPYIKERAKKHKAKVGWFNWRQIVQVDMMQKLMEIHKRNIDLIKEVRSFALNSVAKHFLGEEKVVHEETIWELFTKNPEKLKKYNIQDCVLLLKLDQKLKIIGQKVAEHSISGCFLNEFAVSRILDVYILKNAVGSGIRFKTKPPREDSDFDPNRKAGYVGGLVLDPVRGIHYNVVHFDFTSLYPSIIQTFNISPETWLREKKEGEEIDMTYIYTPNGQVFRREQGIIPRTIKGLLKARNDIRYNELTKLKEGTKEYEVAYFKQYAFKTISNSFYGILGASFTRYYRKETAEAITLSGHFMLRLVEEYCAANGIEVLYGDTDSVFVKSKHHIDENQVHIEINNFIAYFLFKNFGITDSHMDLKVEAVYDSFLLLDKKRYVKNEHGKLKIVGLEARRREVLPFAAAKQIEFLEKILLQKLEIDDIIDWLLDLKQYVTSGKMTKEEVMLQIKLSKHADDYRKKIKDKEGNPVLDADGNETFKPSVLAHIKVANWLKDNGIKENGINSWEKGCYVKYIITDGSKKLDATSVYNYEEGQYDPSYYWDVKIYAPILRILQVVFPEHDWEGYLVKRKVRRTRKKKDE